MEVMPIARIPSLLTALLFLLVSPGLSAQALPPLTERVEVNVVSVQVVVTDRRGKRIEGLTASDFVIREGRRRKEITNFSEYRVEPGVGLDVRDERSLDAPAQPAVQREPRTLLVIVDLRFLPVNQRSPVFDALRRLVDESLQEGDRGAILTLSPRLVTRQHLTSSRSELVASLDEVERAMGLTAREQYDGALQETFFAEMREFRKSLGGEGEMEEELSRREQAMLHFLGTKRRTAALGSLFDRYGAVEGRKIALLVSPFFHPGEHRAHWDNTYLWIERIGESASANGFTLHALHPEGLQSELPDASSRDASGPSGMETFALAQKQIEGLEVMTELAGGLPFYGVAELGSMVNEVLHDLGSYYSIGYRHDSAGDKPATVRVETKDRSLRVRSRQMVIRRSPVVQAKSGLLANLFDPSNATQFELGLVAWVPVKQRRSWTVPIEVRFRLGDLIRNHSEDGERIRLSILVTSADSRGDIAPIQQRQHELLFDSETFDPNRIVTYTIDLTLRPGPHVVSIALLDENGPQTAYGRLLVNADEPGAVR
jgi:VWFA-related protein